tara:strand:- start:851 stop:1000 length:150 start_codon:yes stop_codon:yes gene_type:complete
MTKDLIMGWLCAMAYSAILRLGFDVDAYSPVNWGGAILVLAMVLAAGKV